jgi:hypothetical protein
MTVTTLVICELIWLGLIVFLWLARADAGARPIVGLVQFCCFALAVVSIALLPVVYRARRMPPPRAFVAFAAIAAGVPFFVAIWQILA